MINWKRQLKEKEGTYEFSGFLLATLEVMQILYEAEIISILLDVKEVLKKSQRIRLLASLLKRSRSKGLPD